MKKKKRNNEDCSLERLELLGAVHFLTTGSYSELQNYNIAYEIFISPTASGSLLLSEAFFK